MNIDDQGFLTDNLLDGTKSFWEDAETMLEITVKNLDLDGFVQLTNEDFPNFDDLAQNDGSRFASSSINLEDKSSPLLKSLEPSFLDLDSISPIEFAFSDDTETLTNDLLDDLFINDKKELFDSSYEKLKGKISCNGGSPISHLLKTSTSSSANGRIDKPLKFKCLTRTVDRNKKVRFLIDSCMKSRIDRYLYQMKQTGHYEIEVAKQEEAIKSLKGDVELLDRSLYERMLVSFLLPNDICIEDFEDLQQVDGWTYVPNNLQISKRLPLRLCNQKANFYEPLVKRFKFEGEKTIREALCPYCKVVFSELDKCFYDTKGSNYMHHVAKNHGVWNIGYEMPPPVVVKHNNKLKAICSICNVHPELNRVNFHNLDGEEQLENQVIAYYRHCFKMHNMTKKGRTNEQKAADAQWFIVDSHMQKLLYEQP